MQPLPSFDGRLTATGKGWWQDREHLATAPANPWAGSDLDGANGSTDLPIAGVTGAMGKRVDSTTGKPLIQTGLIRESDVAEDPFKQRTIKVIRCCSDYDCLSPAPDH